MSDFSNHNIFAYMLATCANLNFHPVQNTRALYELIQKTLRNKIEAIQIDLNKKKW